MQSDPPFSDHFDRLWWVRTDAPLTYEKANAILVKLRASQAFERNPQRWQAYTHVIEALDVLQSTHVDVFHGSKIARLLRRAAANAGWTIKRKARQRVPLPDDGLNPTLRCVRCGEVLPRDLFLTRVEDRVEVADVVIRPRGRLTKLKMARTCRGCRLALAARQRRTSRARLEYQVLLDYEAQPDRGGAYRAYDILLQRERRLTADYLSNARRGKAPEPVLTFYVHKQRYLAEALRRLQQAADDGGEIPVKPLIEMSWRDLLPAPVNEAIVRMYEVANQCQRKGRRPALDAPVPNTPTTRGAHRA